MNKSIFYISIISLFYLVSCSSSKQIATAVEPTKNINVDSLTVFEMNEIDKKPQIEGGFSSILTLINYPEAARRKHAEGRVVVGFIVTKTGEGVNYYIAQPVHPALDKEALRVVRQAEFLPALKDGKPVNVKFVVPIIFKLN